MKNKIIFAAVTAALFSSATVFAADTVVHKKIAHKKAISKKVTSTLVSRTKALEDQFQLLKGELTQLQKAKDTKPAPIDLDGLYGHGPAVVSSPAYGLRNSADNDSDLMIGLSSINKDLKLLQIRQKMDNYYTENKNQVPERPIIAVSGGVEGEFSYKNNHHLKNNADINFSRAELDVFGEASPWATAAMILSYDDNRGDGIRVDNSKFQLKQGFLTIGQLNKCPLYLTVGQVYAPFGKYSSYMVTDAMTKLLARVKDRMVVLGYSQHGLYAQAYGFAGETRHNNSEILDHTGFNLGFTGTDGNFSMDVAAGIIGDFAESAGMQHKIFETSELVHDRVPGLNGRVKFDYNPFTLTAEYVGATKAFNVNDIAFNGAGAKPQAIEIEGGFDFKIKNKPNTLALGYGQTWQTLAFGLPKQSFFAVYNVSLIKKTIESIEFRHNVNYNSSDVGAGKGHAVGVSGNRHSNVVTAQIGVYF